MRPRLWRTAARQLRALAPDRWWRRAPFVPLPDRDWMAFRLTTAYGDPDATIVADDVIAWLEWSSSLPTRSKTATGARTGRS